MSRLVIKLTLTEIIRESEDGIPKDSIRELSLLSKPISLCVLQPFERFHLLLSFSEGDVHPASLPLWHGLYLTHISLRSPHLPPTNLPSNSSVKKMPLSSFMLTLVFVPLISGALSLKKSVNLSKVGEKKMDQFPTLRTLLCSMAKDVSPKEVIRKLFKSKLRRMAILKQTKLSFEIQDVRKLFKPVGKSEPAKKKSSQIDTNLPFLVRIQ